MEWNIAPEFEALVILAIIWVYSRKGSNLPILKNKMFQACIIVTVIGISSNILSTIMIYNYTIIPIWLTWLITMIYFLFTPLMGFVYFGYVLSVIYGKIDEIKKMVQITTIPSFIYVLLIIENIFGGHIFRITLEDGYVRGSWIIVTYLVVYFYCIASVIIVIYNRKKIGGKTASILVSFPVIGSAIVIIQQFFSNIILSGFASSCSLLIIYLYLQNKQIYIDYLTKIPNRWELLNMLEVLLQRSGKEKKFCLLVVSLRDFKHINDMFGQHTGDLVLQEFSQFLCEIAPKDSVYRFNGDEFAILYSDGKEEGIQYLIEKIQKRIEGIWYIRGYECKLSLAIGIVEQQEENQTLESLVQSVEYAVTEAKKRKDTYICYCDEKMLQQLVRKKQVIQILREKLEDKSFEMYYQPIYAVQEEKFLYAESLMRMNDTPIGPIYPSEFIPIAEETGIIIEMTYVILDKVCEFVKKLLEEGVEINSVHVNFSAIQFSQFNLDEKVIDIIKKNGIPNNSIKIEFTESALAESTETVTKFALSMKRQGIKMGLDDFGTGYSNIATVLKIPFNAIKLDKSLVWAAMENKNSRLSMKNLMKAFKDLGMQVVAEGVETEEQRQLVCDFGVDQIQGYYYSKPLSEEQALEFFKQQKKKAKSIQ